MNVKTLPPLILLVKVSPPFFPLAGYGLFCEPCINQVSVKNLCHFLGKVEEGFILQCAGKLARMPQEAFFTFGKVPFQVAHSKRRERQPCPAPRLLMLGFQFQVCGGLVKVDLSQSEGTQFTETEPGIPHDHIRHASDVPEPLRRGPGLLGEFRGLRETVLVFAPGLFEGHLMKWTFSSRHV